MDNLTHSLAGWALAETGLKHRSRKGLAACVLAANMPDLDVFFGWAPWAPLATHRGFTHGLLGGVLLMPPLLAGLLWLLDRWQVQRGAAFRSGLPMHFGWVVTLSYLGAITHPLLDLQNVYAVQLLSLASTRWFHTDALFIVSPWLLAILASGILLSRRWTSGKPAIVALAGAIAFVLLNLGISALAWQAPSAGRPDVQPDRVFASPEPILFWRRDMIWRQNGIIGFGRYDPLRNVRELTNFEPSVPDNMGDPAAIVASTATPAIRKFLAWSQMPLASIVHSDCRAEVTFGDARFTGPALSRNFNVSVVVPDPRCRDPR